MFVRYSRAVSSTFFVVLASCLIYLASKQINRQSDYVHRANDVVFTYFLLIISGMVFESSSGFIRLSIRDNYNKFLIKSFRD